MTSANLTREETADRAAHIYVDTIDVLLDVTGAPDPECTGFPVTTTLTFTSTTPSTWFDFVGNAVHEVIVNGQVQPVVWDGARITVSNLVVADPAGTDPSSVNVVRIVAEGAYSRSGEGLHRYVDPADGNTYLYTQYEPADSRRVMVCAEQPDVKASYEFTVTAPAGWEVLNNTVPVDVVEGEGSRTVRFARTDRISSYITCVAAGPYHRVDSVWRSDEQTVELGVLCRASLAQYLDADDILEVTKQGLSFFTSAFGSVYPWGKYDQIFVPEYNLGAMENPGLVTFTEAYVFRGAATHAQFEGRANTILHEMAHMWFGDLVTMRWWDDLWLKESFADYMGAHAAAAATKYRDAWVTFANRRKAWAYQQDQLPTTHPIVADIPDVEAAKLNFDGITYAKGASVLKQLVGYVGQDAFFAAARQYFDRHAYGNTTLQDLLTILNETSGRDLNTWADAWLSTSGVTTITAVDAPEPTEGKRPVDSVEMTQDPVRPHRLVVGLYTWDGDRLVRSAKQDVTLTEASTTITVPGWDSAPLRIVNDDDWTYAKVRLDATSLATVSTHVHAITEPLARALVWSSLWNAVRDAQLSARTYLDIVARHAQHETNSALLGSQLANAAFAVDHYVHRDVVADVRVIWLDTVWEGLHAAPGGSDAQVLWARALAHALAAVSDTPRGLVVHGWLNGTIDAPTGLVLDADIRWMWLTALATTGVVGEDDITGELDRDRTGSGRVAAVRARASQPDQTTRAAAWNDAWTNTSLSNEDVDALISGITAGARSDLIAEVQGEYWDRVNQVWADRSIEIARRLVTGLFPVDAVVAAVSATQGHSTDQDPASLWLAHNPDAPGALRRLIIEQHDHAVRGAKAQLRDASN